MGKYLKIKNQKRKTIKVLMMNAWNNEYLNGNKNIKSQKWKSINEEYRVLIMILLNIKMMKIWMMICYKVKYQMAAYHLFPKVFVKHLRQINPSQIHLCFM